MALEMVKSTKNNINLLPAELRYGLLKRIMLYQETHTKQFLIYSAGAFFAMVIVISSIQSMLTGRFLNKIQIMESSIRQLQARHKEALGIMDQVGQAKQMLEFQTGLLAKRNEFLKTQYNFGHHWAVTLTELQRIVPKGVWLVGVKTEEYYLKITGGAFDENLVSDFMTALRKSPAFSNVSFNFTQNSQVGKTKVVLFEITCNYNFQFVQTP